MAAKVKRQKRLTGILARPIRDLPEPENMIVLACRGEIEKMRAYEKARASHLAGELAKRLRALCEHYGIPDSATNEDRYFSLTMRLAQDYIPAFTVTKAERSKRWTGLAKLRLIRDVERERGSGRRRKTIPRACRTLVLRGRPYEKHSAAYLEQAYGQAKKQVPDWPRLIKYLGELENSRDQKGGYPLVVGS